jgi:hypothetical protein
MGKKLKALKMEELVSLTETDIKILKKWDIMPVQLVMPNFYDT